MPGAQPRRPWGLRDCKKPGKEAVDSADGFCYDGLWSKKTYFSINGGECSWIFADVQDETGHAVRGHIGAECGCPWTWSNHIPLRCVPLSRRIRCLAVAIILTRCIFMPIFGRKEDTT